MQPIAPTPRSTLAAFAMCTALAVAFAASPRAALAQAPAQASSIQSWNGEPA